ncbi:MAG: MBL fold metallo-hydrolase [Acidimicrobiia bacterium]|nr:MBL fold metallo-hydrolase [Acidimicrobiia bacterium]
MDLTVLGSAGGYPTPGVATSGYLIDHAETRIWCDIGAGTLMHFPDQLDTVDAVVISHEHPDHCLDLLALFHALAYPYPIGARAKMPVYAPQAVIDKMIAFVSPNQTDVIARTFEFVPVADATVLDIGSIRVGFRESHHPVHTVAMRFEADGRSLAYTGDTGPEGTWHAIADGADVFLCEATLVGTRAEFGYPYHLNATEAGQVGRSAGVGRLVITHIPRHWEPERPHSEAAAAFGDEVSVALPGGSFLI